MQVAVYPLSFLLILPSVVLAILCLTIVRLAEGTKTFWGFLWNAFMGLGFWIEHPVRSIFIVLAVLAVLAAFAYAGSVATWRPYGYLAIAVSGAFCIAYSGYWITNANDWTTAAIFSLPAACGVILSTWQARTVFFL